MPQTDWIHPGSVSGTGWAALTGTEEESVEVVADGKLVRHSSSTFSPDYLICNDLGQSLNADDVIEGIEVRIGSYYYQGSLISGLHVYAGLYLTTDGSSPATSEKETSELRDYDSLNFDSFILGGSADSWGIALTGADVNDSNFGVLVTLGTSTTQLKGLDVDELAIRITYSETVIVVPGVIDSGTRYLPGCSVKDVAASLRRS